MRYAASEVFADPTGVADGIWDRPPPRHVAYRRRATSPVSRVRKEVHPSERGSTRVTRSPPSGEAERVTEPP